MAPKCWQVAGGPARLGSAAARPSIAAEAGQMGPAAVGQDRNRAGGLRASPHTTYLPVTTPNFPNLHLSHSN